MAGGDKSCLCTLIAVLWAGRQRSVIFLQGSDPKHRASKGIKQWLLYAKYRQVIRNVEPKYHYRSLAPTSLMKFVIDRSVRNLWKITNIAYAFRKKFSTTEAFAVDIHSRM